MGSLVGDEDPGEVGGVADGADALEETSAGQQPSIRQQSEDLVDVGREYPTGVGLLTAFVRLPSSLAVAGAAWVVGGEERLDAVLAVPVAVGAVEFGAGGEALGDAKVVCLESE